MMTYAGQLRAALQEQKIIVAPGVFDGLSALLAKQVGFSVLYASGGAIARARGYPDLGLLTMTEVLSALAGILDACQLPIIADADTGFGGLLNLKRTVSEYERLGMAGLHIEDQSFPKRCGHLKNKSLISTEEMLAKIIAAKEASLDPDFLIIARTDAIAVEGFDKAILRAKAYIKAGADFIFVEAPETVAQIEQIAQQLPHPKLINMFSGGKTPLVSVEQLKKLGYNLVIIPSDLQRSAIKAMQKTLAVIYKEGNSAAIESMLSSFNEREQIIGTEIYLKQDEQALEKALSLNSKSI